MYSFIKFVWVYASIFLHEIGVYISAYKWDPTQSVSLEAPINGAFQPAVLCLGPWGVYYKRWFSGKPEVVIINLIGEELVNPGSSLDHLCGICHKGIYHKVVYITFGSLKKAHSRDWGDTCMYPPLIWLCIWAQTLRLCALCLAPICDFLGKLPPEGLDRTKKKQ